MKRPLRAAGVLLALIAALVLLSMRHHRTPVAPRGTWLQGTTACAFRAAGADVQVEATAQADCAQVQASLGRDDSLSWSLEPSLTPVSSSGQPEYETCAVVSPPMRVTVEDSAAGGYGMGLCNDALHSGWKNATAT